MHPARSMSNTWRESFLTYEIRRNRVQHAADEIGIILVRRRVLNKVLQDFFPARQYLVLSTRSLQSPGQIFVHKSFAFSLHSSCETLVGCSTPVDFQRVDIIMGFSALESSNELGYSDWGLPELVSDDDCMEHHSLLEYSLLDKLDSEDDFAVQIDKGWEGLALFEEATPIEWLEEFDFVMDVDHGKVRDATKSDAEGEAQAGDSEDKDVDMTECLETECLETDANVTSVSTNESYEVRLEQSLKNLIESMQRSRETRMSLSMKTTKTVKYERRQSVQGVLKSVAESTFHLERILRYTPGNDHKGVLSVNSKSTTTRHQDHERMA